MDLHRLVDFGLLNIPTFDANAGMVKGLPELDTRLLELTRRFSLTAFALDAAMLPSFASVDEALAAGNRDFCLLQNAGNLFVAAPGLAPALRAALDTCVFLTGHIMERGRYYYLHDQCTLINRRAWERLGRPPFGVPSSGRAPVTMAERSVENVHDDYTPRYLDSTGIKVPLQALFGYGWNAISVSLEHDLRVVNWSDDVRRHKRHCYAYYGDPQEWLRALSAPAYAPPTHDERLAGILDLLRTADPAPEGLTRP